MAKRQKPVFTSKADTLTAQLLTTVTQIRDTYIGYAKELDEIQHKLAIFYHDAERMDVTHVSQGYNLFLDFQEMLVRRRFIKSDAAQLKLLVDSLNIPLMTTQVEVVLKEIEKTQKSLDKYLNSTESWKGFFHNEFASSAARLMVNGRNVNITQTPVNKSTGAKLTIKAGTILTHKALQQKALGAAKDLTPAQRRQIFQRDNKICQVCGGNAAGVLWVDPSKFKTIDNCVSACETCYSNYNQMRMLAQRDGKPLPVAKLLFDKLMTPSVQPQTTGIPALVTAVSSQGELVRNLQVPQDGTIRDTILARDKHHCRLCGDVGQSVIAYDPKKGKTVANSITACEQCCTNLNKKRNASSKTPLPILLPVVQLQVAQ